MAKSTAKGSSALQDQIHIARKNLSEWPSWMREAARFEGSNLGRSKSGSGTPSATNSREKKK